ncbi:tetratricopeptide repeat protein [Leptothoe sp. PORK10 BA2]|uniref:tetratricopeptide repeat protein n=1 Tax=Leptothoe sp. PORK10 BA2 TaxID=3110254 RepID=UPI002B2028AE|nr:hypothetical protein [Leptothoe sp. PORK10 BA2]MEA5462418.1 hypothetical protein [Leptothoe sp. PORK10 BA2]
MARASIIEAYIQRLLAWKQPITPSTRATIAAEVGITQGELDAIQLKVEGHIVRGLNHQEFDLLDRAIDELAQAQALDPINLEVLHTLADIYYQRYQQDSSQAYGQQALLMAERCIELKPNDKRAQALIKDLENHTSAQISFHQTKPNIFILIGFLENAFSPKKISRRTKTKIALLIVFLQQPVVYPQAVASAAATVAVFSASVVAVMVGLANLDRIPGFADAATEPKAGTELAEGPSSPDKPVSNPAFDPGPNIPVTFDHPGLLIEPRLSRLGEYEGEDYYKLHGIVINDSGQEVRMLKLKVEMLDGDGVAISTINPVAVTDPGTIIWPGDTQSFKLFHKITPDLISVRVTVTDIEQYELFSSK